MKYPNISKDLPYVVGKATDSQPLAIAAFSDQAQATSWHGTISKLPQFTGVELFDNVNNKALVGGSGQTAKSNERELESQR